MTVAVTVAVAVSGGGAVAVAGLTKRFFNHIQKDFLINVWGYPVLTPMSEHVGAVLFCTFFFRRPHVARPHLKSGALNADTFHVPVVQKSSSTEGRAQKSHFFKPKSKFSTVR